jgi:hypothetical protein
MDASEALDLGFAPVKVDEKGEHRTIILDAMKFADVDNVRWGVGLRFTLHAWSLTASVEGSVPLVAAQATLNIAFTRMEFEIIGMDVSSIASSLPGFEEMNVSSYSDLMIAIDRCRGALLTAQPDQLKPHPVAVFVQATPNADHGSGVHWPKLLHHRCLGSDPALFSALTANRPDTALYRCSVTLCRSEVGEGQTWTPVQRQEPQAL